MIDPATAPVGCSSAERRRIMSVAQALGVPRDYARTRQLRSVREPQRLIAIGRDIQGRPQWLIPRAARAWLHLCGRAFEDGVVLHIVSAYRSADYQLGILKRKLDRGLGIEEILRVSAAPGYSEHHSGRALDVSTPGYPVLEEGFEASPAFAWLKHSARKFGFALSYPRGNHHGIVFEPWHWCWHAKLAAKKSQR